MKKPIGEVLEGDAREVLPTLTSGLYATVLTDPPYLTGLLNAPFDEAAGAASTDPAFWRQVLRVLRPGGHVVAFGGTRTYHKLATAVEAAGFEVRDVLTWLYGSGFPKSLNLGNQGLADWAGWGTALKPTSESVLLARKPLEGTTVENVTKYETGALNVDACRGSAEGLGPDKPGRWPPNTLLSHSPDCDEAGCTSDCPVLRLEDQQPGSSVYFPRFFYCGKTTKKERDAGCAKPELPAKGHNQTERALFRWQTSHNHHPTVKPLALLRWLVRLTTPPGGLVLDPFVGSGSTVVAANLEGHDALGVEREVEYASLARARVRYWRDEATPQERGKTTP